MERLVLKEEVLIPGPNFKGYSTSVLLHPVKERGWFWYAGNDIVPITPELLSRRKNRLTLTHKGHKLHVFEHLGPLRFSGLDSVLIIPESSWLPYDGSAIIFWDACKYKLHPAGTLDYCRAKPLKHEYKQKNKRLRYDPFTLGNDRVLHVNVEVDYRRLGNCKLHTAVSEDRFDEIAYPKTQGWPPSRRPLAIAAGWCGWPHRHNAIWPQEHSPEETRYLFAAHRRLDLLGALSTVCLPGHTLSGQVSSYRAGHKEDVKFVQGLQVESMCSVLA